MKDNHWYYMTQRPPMPGSFPRGVVDIKEYWPPISVDGVSDHVYGEIGYERELMPEEIWQYELKERSKTEKV